MSLYPSISSQNDALVLKVVRFNDTKCILALKISVSSKKKICDSTVGAHYEIKEQEILTEDHISL